MLKKVYGLYDRLGNFYDDRFILANNEGRSEEVVKREFCLLIDRYSTSSGLRSLANDLELRLIGDFNTENGYLRSYDENVIVMTGSQALAYLQQFEDTEKE